MPISATGRKRNGSGFTLIEVLVVLVIVAVLAGVLVLNYGQSDRQRLHDEAARLTTVLNFAVEEAIVRGSELGLIIDDAGYRFVVFNPHDERWEPVVARPLTAHTFVPGVAVDLQLPEEGMDPAARRTITAIRNRERALQPQLLVFPGGEMTPFALGLTLADASARVAGDGFNAVEWSDGATENGS